MRRVRVCAKEYDSKMRVERKEFSKSTRFMHFSYTLKTRSDTESLSFKSSHNVREATK